MLKRVFPLEECYKSVKLNRLASHDYFKYKIALPLMTISSTVNTCHNTFCSIHLY